MYPDYQNLVISLSPRKMNDFEDYLERYKSITDRAQKFLYITRDIDLQKQFKNEIEDLITETIEWKEYGVDQSDENLANQQLAFENILKALLAELNMWISFKKDDMHSAWDFLIDSQSHTRTALQAHKIAEPSESYAQRLHNIEKLLFPPQIFNSPGFLVKKAKCSICGKDYEECDHIKGRPYMGEICSRIIEDAELLEVSIVDVPASKKARMHQMTNENGDTIDLLTLKKINE